MGLSISLLACVMGEVEHLWCWMHGGDRRSCRKAVSCRLFGIYPEHEAMVKEGFRFFLMGVDFLYMKQASMEALKMARS